MSSRCRRNIEDSSAYPIHVMFWYGLEVNLLQENDTFQTDTSYFKHKSLCSTFSVVIIRYLSLGFAFVLQCFSKNLHFCTRAGVTNFSTFNSSQLLAIHLKLYRYILDLSMPSGRFSPVSQLGEGTSSHVTRATHPSPSQIRCLLFGFSLQVQRHSKPTTFNSKVLSSDYLFNISFETRRAALASHSS